jgi:hypothetical protein
MAVEKAPPGHRAARSVLLVALLMGLATMVGVVVESGFGGRAVEVLTAIAAWSWDFPWFL